MREPCGCGATDCPECYPMNFYRGRYIYRSCDDCGEEFEPEDQEDESRRCPDCQRKADGIRECAECGENFDFKGEETICPACIEAREEEDLEEANRKLAVLKRYLCHLPLPVEIVRELEGIPAPCACVSELTARLECLLAEAIATKKNSSAGDYEKVGIVEGIQRCIEAVKAEAERP